MSQEETNVVAAEVVASETAGKKTDAAPTSLVDVVFDKATRAAVDVLRGSRIALGKGAEVLATGADKLGTIADNLSHTPSSH